MTATLADQRDHFELVDGVTYLNCAYMAPQLRAVTAAGHGAVAAKAHPWEITPADFFTDLERLRGIAAGLLGGHADGVAVVPSVSYAMAVAARALAHEVAAGDELVVLADQFPSNVYPWRDLAARRDAHLVTVPRPADDDWTSAVLATLGERTAVVALPACHWSDGTLVDLERIGEAVRAVGAALVVDASQSLGAQPFDVGRVRPDFLASVGYKWQLGPFSLGYLWVDGARRDGEPLEQGWFSRAGSEDFTRLTDYRDAYQPGARRFDVGEVANFVLVPMAVAALEQVHAWGPARIAASLRALTDAAAAGGDELGLAAPPAAARADHMVGLRLPATVAPDLTERLAAAGVHVSVRAQSMRISPHLYNTHADVERLLAVVGGAV